MALIYANEAKTTLLGPLSQGSTSVSVPFGFAAVLNTYLSGGNTMKGVITQAGFLETTYEIVTITAATTGSAAAGDTVTVTRAQESTQQGGDGVSTWPAGSKFENRITAAAMNTALAGGSGGGTVSATTISVGTGNTLGQSVRFVQSGNTSASGVPTELSNYSTGGRVSFSTPGQISRFSGTLVGKQGGSALYYSNTFSFDVVNNGGVCTISNPVTGTAIAASLTGTLSATINTSGTYPALVLSVSAGTDQPCTWAVSVEQVAAVYA